MKCLIPFVGQLLVCFGLLFLLLNPAAAEMPSARPNIVFFLVDDLGYVDLGCFGSRFYETPNIDELAASGMRLTNAYAACQVCSPTRASIMTGKYPARMQTTDWFGADQPHEWRRQTQLLPAPYLEQLPSQEVTLADTLRAAGYQTFFAGKWHLGPQGCWPEDRGFDINVAGCDWGRPQGKTAYFSPYGFPNFEDGPRGEYLTERLTDETCRFIARHDTEQPLFVYLSFYTVHAPLQAPERLVHKYRQKKERLGDAVADRWIQEMDSKVRQTQNHPAYSGMVESLDTAVGRVLATLDAKGIADDTLIVFTSDNGGLSSAEGSPTSNLPLRGGKGWIYEGGIREPTLVRWPGVTRAGAVSDAVITSTDYYPTLLEVAGIEPLPQQHVDGKSFVTALRGKAFDRGPVFWHYPHYGNQGGRPSAAVRDGRWKLIQWYEDDRLDLYDLDADIGEQTNLVEHQPAVAQRLLALLNDWREETGARMPTPNPNYPDNRK